MSDYDLCMYNTRSKNQHTSTHLSVLLSVISSIRRGSFRGRCEKKEASVEQPGIITHTRVAGVDGIFIGEILCYGYIRKYVFPSLHYKCEDGLPRTICLRLSLTSLHQVDTDATSLAAFLLKFSFNPYVCFASPLWLHKQLDCIVSNSWAKSHIASSKLPSVSCC